tara:strand:- start:50 stop:340 length:291 start_codon:yes stop_codon:yes gene_type:complete
MALYEVSKLEPVEAPEKGGEGPWWRYEIECGVHGSGNMTGTRCGKREEVEAFLGKMLDSINHRTRGKQSVQLRLASSSPRSIPVNNMVGHFNRGLR